MCTGIALAQSEIPLELFERHGLQKRIFERGGEKEVRFLFRSAVRLLPVWHGGQLQIIRWGCRRGESRHLPLSGWTWKESVENGRWGGFEAELVEIPASMGLDNGIWYRIRQGVSGLLVHDERNTPVVYMVCEQASHYYKTMTRSDRMPVLVGERI
jgi:hypothetical protein